jgi:glutathione S-transferase
MHLTAWITLAALGLYAWTGTNVARARGAYKIKAPVMDGPLPFQSVLRVHANTLEQLPLLLAPLWMCAMFLGDSWAAAGGALWCVGRIVYALGYYKDPSKREAGFVIAFIASALLFLGTGVGLILH